MNDVVAAVAVTYSPGESLTAFLDSLAAATGRPLKVVLADNGSTDGSVQAAAHRPSVRLVETGGNLGYGRAANLGVHETTAEFVVVANPDVVWEPGSLDRLLEAAERWPERRGVRSAHPYAGRRHLPVSAGVAVVGARDRARGVRLVVAHQSVDRGLPGRAAGSGRARRRLAVGVVPAAAPPGVRPGRWLRPVLLHVLRGSRSRRPARP